MLATSFQVFINTIYHATDNCCGVLANTFSHSFKYKRQTQKLSTIINGLIRNYHLCKMLQLLVTDRYSVQCRMTGVNVKAVLPLVFSLKSNIKFNLLSKITTLQLIQLLRNSSILYFDTMLVFIIMNMTLDFFFFTFECTYKISSSANSLMIFLLNGITDT